MTDIVNHPAHYTNHPSGVECIQITEHMGFNLGNAVKYIWRADEKGNALEDLAKAVWYLEREIGRRERAKATAIETAPAERCGRVHLPTELVCEGIPEHYGAHVATSGYTWWDK